MKSREFKYLRDQAIRRHQNAPVRMSVGSSGILVKGGIKCGECGLSFPKNQVLKCINGEETEWLCDNCNDGTWYCKCCGQFSAGISSFEISGLCDNCRDENEAEDFPDFDDEYDRWESEGWE
jgi:hypothetical protein